MFGWVIVLRQLFHIYYLYAAWYTYYYNIKLTLSVQNRTTLDNSCTTRSTHLMQGSFSRPICFLTIASNAISGVNRPTYNKRYLLFLLVQREMIRELILIFTETLISINKLYNEIKHLIKTTKMSYFCTHINYFIEVYLLFMTNKIIKFIIIVYLVIIILNIFFRYWIYMDNIIIMHYNIIFK
jgi:hypothetical protein